MRACNWSEPTAATSTKSSWTRDNLGLVLQIAKLPDYDTCFDVLPRRWVVKGALACITRHRRCAHDYERLPQHHEAIVR